MIDSISSIHICCEKKKISKPSLCDGGLISLPNDEKVKVEVIRNVFVMIHDAVKRKLGDVRSNLNVERNLISLGRSEAKGCSFKASSRSLKVIRRSMVLMRGKRSDSNLYMVKVNDGFLGHKVDDACNSPKKVTFDDGGRVGLE